MGAYFMVDGEEDLIRQTTPRTNPAYAASLREVPGVHGSSAPPRGRGAPPPLLRVALGGVGVSRAGAPLTG